MFHICGALFFALVGSTAVGMNDDSPDRVKTYLKTRTDIIIREDPLSLKDIQQILLINVKRFVFKVADPEELVQIAARLIQFSQLKAVITVEGHIDVTLKKLIELQDVRKQITLQFCEPQPSKVKEFERLSIEDLVPIGDVPETLFDYVNLELQLGPEIAGKVKRLKSKSDKMLLQAREDAMGEICLVGSSIWKEMTIEGLKGRIGQIYDRYLDGGSTFK